MRNRESGEQVSKLDGEAGESGPAEFFDNPEGGQWCGVPGRTAAVPPEGGTPGPSIPP